MVFAALRVVTTKNVVHAALWLVLVLAGVAAQYILAAAEFVAVSQVLVYVGAVMVLFLFGIMLTRAQIGRERGLNNRNWGIGIPVAAGAARPAGVGRHRRLRATRRCPTSGPTPTEAIADDVLSPYLVPFLAISFILLAAAIGAIVLARRTERVLAVNFLLLGAVLFCIGVYGVIARRNAVMVLMSVELILNAVNLNLIAFALHARQRRRPGLRPLRHRRGRRRGRRRPGDGAARVPQPALDRPRRAQRDEGLDGAARRLTTGWFLENAWLIPVIPGSPSSSSSCSASACR